MYHQDQRRARAAPLNIVPTSTGVTKTIAKIFPELEGKLSGSSIRVPTPNVSLIDFTFTAIREVCTNNIRAAIKKHANGDLKNILGYTSEYLVSCDFNHDPRSAIVDFTLVSSIDDKMGHIVAWYDNEWGFSNRMLDIAEQMF
jgi:glyceraldehyde 3-phosphate dehydrogenase